MSASAICLFGLIAWTIVLTFILLGARGAAMMKGHPVAPFDQDGGDLDAFGTRVTRAHGNSLEWLTIPAALLVYAIAAGQADITDGLAMWVLYARVLQSIAHMISISTPLVLTRATLFTVQVVIWIIWMVKLA
jgi:uncharacterized MAPEG superfamily protein